MLGNVNIELVKGKIKRAKETGLFHIMVSTGLSQILSFLSGIIIIRIVTKSDYGIYSYANNTLYYFKLLSGMGLSIATFQICCERQKNGLFPDDIFGYGVTWSYLIDIFLGVMIIAYSYFVGGDISGAEKYLAWMSFIPLANISFDMAVIYFRSRLDNQSYAHIFLLHYIVTFLFSIVGSFLFGVWGIIISNYLGPIIALSFAKIKRGYSHKYVFKIKEQERRDIWKLAIPSLAANAISCVMSLIDISVIGYYFKDELKIASYKIAAMIPNALVLLATTIVLYVYPYFAMHKDDAEWTKRMAIKLTFICCCIFGFVSLFLIVFARPIIVIVFGERYADVVDVFRILSLSFFFQSTFKCIYGNLLVTQRKVVFNVVDGILSGILNIIGNYVLIQKYDIRGVAVATLVVTIASGTFSAFYFFYSVKRKDRIKICDDSLSL